MPGAVIEEAFKARGFDSFEDYLAARSGWTLVRMADELDVKEQTFIVYHSRWIDERAEAGEVAPLRLED